MSLYASREQKPTKPRNLYLHVTDLGPVAALIILEAEM